MPHARSRICLDLSGRWDEMLTGTRAVKVAIAECMSDISYATALRFRSLAQFESSL